MQPETNALLEELGLQKESNAVTSVTPLQILQKLLADSTLSADDVRRAHAELTKSSDAIQTLPPNQKQGTREAAPEAVTKAEAASQEQRNASIRRRHIALHIYYDGEKYSGLAENVGREDDRSVERSLFAALQKTHLIDASVDGETARKSAQYSRCGRTDRGVSAAGQVVALKLKSAFAPGTSWDESGEKAIADEELPTNSYQTLQVFCPQRPKNSNKKKKKAKAETEIMDKEASKPCCRKQRDLKELAYDKILNNVLPPDIRVLGWAPVSEDFSARFSASTRTYRYFFNNEHGLLDLSRMQSALALMEGEHDFRNFCKIDVENVSNFVRKIYHAHIYCCNPNKDATPFKASKEDDSEGNGICYFEIHGQAFLWHQIRCIVQIVFLVGRSLEEPSVVSELLDIEKYPGKPSYNLADEHHLVLHRCGYANLKLGYSVGNLWNLTCHFGRQCEDHLLAAARVRNGLDLLQEKQVMVQDVKEFCRLRLLDREKKSAKYGGRGAGLKAHTSLDEVLTGDFGKAATITWKQALDWMSSLGIKPDPANVNEPVHIPLSMRSKGSTYEEKIASLQQSASSKRKSRYEDNVIKKQKTKEEDQEFYDHMTKQGGSAL